MPDRFTALIATLDAVAEMLRDDGVAAGSSPEADRRAIERARERLTAPCRIAVVGEFSSGKSFLLNALLGTIRREPSGRIAGLLATDINPSTATITELRSGSPPSAVALYPSGRREQIPMDRLARFIAVGRDDERGALHDATADEDAAPSFVLVEIESPFLARGYTVADTPGLASLNPAHRRATLGYLPRTDAVLYLIDTQQPFSDGDAAFLGIVGSHVRTIFIVQTKIDLWRARESDGRAVWESARDRIVARAREHAPGADVVSVSAYEFAVGELEQEIALRERSGFPNLVAALERSLDVRVREARVAHVHAILGEVVARAAARARHAAALAESDFETLVAVRERAVAELTERERALGRARDELDRGGTKRHAWILARGATLSERATQALATALDIADIERIRDRGRFHSLVDATVAPIWTEFANDVAGHVARALERIAESQPAIDVADLAARRLGGIAGTGAWARGLARGIASTVVLGAIGGPTVSFVDAVAQAFRARPYGSYMKRELGEDLRSSFFPAFDREVEAFVARLADDTLGIFTDVSGEVERERAAARAETLTPIDAAIAAADRDADVGPSLATTLERIARIETMLFATRVPAPAPLESERPDAGEVPSLPVASVPPETASIASFDASTYRRGLRPERYRVVVLGALRRGKSSLINAIAQTRILHDATAGEARFPVHVRYGPSERAYGLDGDGRWDEIDAATAMARATRSPVLIETPWTMPRELVIVHAPAFDSGDAEAEAIALAAAEAASEILGLFSRQLSDRELALYARVAELGKPMLLAHTIADNETAHERRTVVELAGRYVRERGIEVSRIFTISALEYFEAARNRRAPAAWNELGALRETLDAHAQAHMAHAAERARRLGDAHHSVDAEARAARAPVSPRLPGVLARLFGRG